MSKKIPVLASIMAAAALVLLVLEVAGLAGGGAGVPGFFFRTFHAAMVYIPLYLGFCALALYSREKSYKLLFTLNLSILPFLTLALFFHTASGNMNIALSRFLVAEMGKGISLPFLFLLFAVEVALIYKLGNFFFPHEPWLPGFESLKALKNKVSSSPAPGSGPSLSSDKQESTQDWQDPVRKEIFEKQVSFDPSAEAFPLPDIPKAIEPVEEADESSIQALISSVIKPGGEKPVLFTPAGVEPPEEEDIPPAEALEGGDPGIDFLMGEGPVVQEASPESPAPVDDFTEVEEDCAEEPEEEEEYGEGYLADRLDIPESLRSEEASPKMSDKLSPEGETEKMGVMKSGFIPRHQRRKEKYAVPVEGILKEYPSGAEKHEDDHTRHQARVLEETLREFKIEATVTGIQRGPVITMFEVQPSPGVKVSKIAGLQDNLSLRLAASRIRIVTPIPGKQAIGIEVPNQNRSIVSYSSLVSSVDFEEAQEEIPVILGKDISGGNQIIDLVKTPHLLIAGSTGSGKSVCVNSLICSILYKRSPQDVKLIMVDPKIVELKLYNDIPHLLTPVITESKRAFQAVQWCLYEMERRYSLLDAMGVRDIRSYNKRIRERDIATSHLPYIVLVIDEFADLMATSGKELEAIIARLAAMSRAVGIHLVLATQRPSIDVITGLIKANFPSRIAFMVASKTDSRIIIDQMGAEKLLGKGDMLFTSAWDPFPSRMQGAFLSEDEVERVVSYVKTLGEPDYIDDEIFLDDEDYENIGGEGDSSFSDPLYDKALDIVLAAGKASASYLQRRLQIGYNRAARLVEEMEIQGIVGPQNGSKPREVVHIPDRPGREMLDTGEAP